MIREYSDRVRFDYNKKLMETTLSANLVAASPAKVRDECVNVYIERFDESDRKVLRDFFGPIGEKEDYESVIRNFDIDKFKPIVKFVRAETDQPQGPVVELLAWLIDYQPRPNRGSTSVPSQTPPVQVDEDEKQRGKLALVISRIKKLWKTPTYRWALIAIIGIVISVANVATRVIEIITDPLEPKCMYWSIDHYEPIECDKKLLNKTIIALDTFDEHNFRLITKPDTLTAYSINKVYYSKTAGKLQIFTGPGWHPTTGKFLKPLSPYMLSKYLGAQPLTLSQLDSLKK